ncbi:RrF2 family transcriptional regulator [Niabella insulamsoli]|uniref:RrF2 family transcriptional regulator n=1 Tax=Niabella insulamsoli TaxID=3144874 RepID=UPI0031FD549C
MFSKATEYGIKAMMYIAVKTRNGERVGVKEIAKNIDAPVHFTAKILQELCRKNLLHSAKGPNGGFYLDSADLKTPLGKIVKTLDGDRFYNTCVLGLKACSHKNPCPVHHEFKVIKEKIIDMLEKNTIGSFNTELINKNFFLKMK